MQVGLIGAGNMGIHFAARWLAVGHGVVVHDARREALQRALQLGAHVATGVGDLASRVDVIVLSLPLPETVLDVASGIAALSQPCRSRLVLDMSTTGAGITAQVDGILSDAGVAFFSAPVSGGTDAAARGALTVMAAGPLAAYQRVMPLLDAVAHCSFFLGADVRLGQTLKLINNTLYAASMLAGCEALVCGVKAGLDASLLLDVINRSSGRCYATTERFQGALDRSFPIRFSAALLRKDVHLALMAADELGVPMQVSKAALRLLDQVIADGLGDADNIAAIQCIEKRAGTVFGDALH